MTQTITQLDQLSAIMIERTRKINDSWNILSADQIDEYEFDLMQFWNQIAIEELQVNYQLIRYDLERSKLYDQYRPDSKSNADAEWKVNSELAEKKCSLKESENTNKLYRKLYENYKRRWDRMQSRAIYDMAQDKRIITNASKQDIPF